MITENMIGLQLMKLQDQAYRVFMARLLPTINAERIIGVRMPALRKLAKELSLEQIGELPHCYHEHNNLHALVINEIADFTMCISELNRFLPFVDNWATCDSLRPKCFKKNKTELLLLIRDWLSSGHTYTVRFALEMLMLHFLDDDFQDMYLTWAINACCDEYYINMMVSWFFATALSKHYEIVLPILEERKLPEWVHKKTIQKAVDSFLITQAQKSYLKELR